MCYATVATVWAGSASDTVDVVYHMPSADPAISTWTCARKFTVRLLGEVKISAPTPGGKSILLRLDNSPAIVDFTDRSA